MPRACRHLKSPQSLSGTSTHRNGHTKVTLMIMNAQLTSLSFYVNKSSHSWNKAISNFGLETSRSRSWVWSKGKVIKSAQYLIDLFPFFSCQSDHQFLRYSYVEIWPCKIQGQGQVWHQRLRSHNSSSIQLIHFLFVSCQLDQSFLRYGQQCLTLKKYIQFLFLDSPRKKIQTEFLQNLIRW